MACVVHKVTTTIDINSLYNINSKKLINLPQSNLKYENIHDSAVQL